jgi:hypothetical protein
VKILSYYGWKVIVKEGEMNVEPRYRWHMESNNVFGQIFAAVVVPKVAVGGCVLVGVTVGEWEPRMAQGGGRDLQV